MLHRQCDVDELHNFAGTVKDSSHRLMGFLCVDIDDSHTGSCLPDRFHVSEPGW